MPKTLPAQPHIDWLKKTAKQQLDELRVRDPAAKLHQRSSPSPEITVSRVGAR
jgi:hypothetical protein